MQNKESSYKSGGGKEHRPCTVTKCFYIAALGVDELRYAKQCKPTDSQNSVRAMLAQQLSTSFRAA